MILILKLSFYMADQTVEQNPVFCTVKINTLTVYVVRTFSTWDYWTARAGL